MPGKMTGTQRTYIIDGADGIAMYTGVTYGSVDGSVAIPTEDNAIPVGVVHNDERLNIPFQAGGSQDGRNIAVDVSGYVEIKLSGNIDFGDKVILGDGGVAKKLPAAAGVYNILGFAEMTGVDGDVIVVRIAQHVVEVAEIVE